MIIQVSSEFQQYRSHLRISLLRLTLLTPQSEGFIQKETQFVIFQLAIPKDFVLLFSNNEEGRVGFKVHLVLKSTFERPSCCVITLLWKWPNCNLDTDIPSYSNCNVYHYQKQNNIIYHLRVKTKWDKRENDKKTGDDKHIQCIITYERRGISI